MPDYPVPFSDGGLHTYPDWGSLTYDAPKGRINYRDPVPEVPAFSFTAELEYQHYGRGRSSAVFWFKSISGEHVGKWFPAQMANMSTFIPLLNGGKFTGEVLTRKQGMNFGIELVRHIE